MLRADKIANRLHDLWIGKTKAAWDFPPKPPRMRWATYQRLLDQYDELNNRWGNATSSLGAIFEQGQIRKRGDADDHPQ
jgi:hypothetical protein